LNFQSGTFTDGGGINVLAGGILDLNTGGSVSTGGSITYDGTINLNSGTTSNGGTIMENSGGSMNVYGVLDVQGTGILGSQTAVVVGKGGGEIFVDKFGRATLASTTVCDGMITTETNSQFTNS